MLSKVVIERRLRELELFGDGRERKARQPVAKDDIQGRVENLGASLIPSALIPGLSFAAGSTVFA